MANYFLVKITIDDGSGSPAPKIVNNIDNGNLQLASAFSADTVKKWESGVAFTGTEANELALFYSQVQAIAAETIVGNIQSIIVDEVTV